MRSKWIFLILVSIASLTILAACGGDEDPSTNPGGLTEEQAGDRAKEIIKANDCDGPAGNYSSVRVDGDTWVLIASIGLNSHTWIFDPAAGTVVETNGVCKT